MPCAQRHRHAALAAAGIEHAPGTHALDLALQLLEFGIARAPIDQLARLAADQHADPLLEELQAHPPAQPAILLLLRATYVSRESRCVSQERMRAASSAYRGS